MTDDVLGGRLGRGCNYPSAARALVLDTHMHAHAPRFVMPTVLFNVAPC